MSKDFEQSYKELAQTEIPDLWDRIEAGLTNKSTPEETVNIEIKKKQETKQKTEKKTVPFIRKYSAVAAALICVAILIPAISLVREFGIGGRKSEETEYIEEAADACAEVAPAEMAVTTEEWAAEEEGLEEAFREEADEEIQEYGPWNKEAALDESENDEAIEEMMAEKAACEEAEFALTERCPEGITLKGVQVKILEVKEAEAYFAEAELQESGLIYLGQVQKASDEVLTAGEQIVIFIPITSSLTLAENGVYELDLTSSAVEEEYYFLIEQYHEQLKP